jgi:hypothetical protein
VPKTQVARRNFNPGDKITGLPEADFHYPMKECILEVEFQLPLLPFGVESPTLEAHHNAATMEIKDTYVHVWKAKDKTTFWKVGKKSFAVCSMYFRLITNDDIAEYMLEDL